MGRECAHLHGYLFLNQTDPPPRIRQGWGGGEFPFLKPTVVGASSVLMGMRNSPPRTLSISRGYSLTPRRPRIPGVCLGGLDFPRSHGFVRGWGGVLAGMGSTKHRGTLAGSHAG